MLTWIFSLLSLHWRDENELWPTRRLTYFSLYIKSIFSVPSTLLFLNTQTRVSFRSIGWTWPRIQFHSLAFYTCPNSVTRTLSNCYTRSRERGHKVNWQLNAHFSKAHTHTHTHATQSLPKFEQGSPLDRKGTPIEYVQWHLRRAHQSPWPSNQKDTSRNHSAVAIACLALARLALAK